MKYFLLIMMLFVMQNCTRQISFKDDELSIQRTDYLGDELRIDGYYYLIYGDGNYMSETFFYRNGMLLKGNAGLVNNIEEHENNYSNGSFYDVVKDSKSVWGVFKVTGNKIFFEKWYPTEGPLPAYVRSGVILNDTTFHITEVYRMQNGEKTDLSTTDEIYHFKQFSPKPDSTNVFVK